MKRLVKYIFFQLLLSTPLLSCEDNKLAWRDLPKLGLASCVGFSDEAMESVDQLITHYHSIPKSELDSLDRRVTLLAKIKSELLVAADKVDNERAVKTLKSLSTIASRKSWYLSQLKELYKKPLEDHPVISGQKIVFNDFVPLPLVNKLIFGSNISAYWGLFWLEALDPCHRMLTSYYVQWDNEKTTIPFFLWLENLDVPWYSPQIRFFTHNELEEATFKLEGGLFYNYNNEKANLYAEAQEFIYIITLNKDILIAKASETVRHISLSLGFPVLAAGALKLIEGKLTYIDGESGHYQPTAFHIRQTIDLLIKLDVQLEEHIAIKYYENGKVIKVSLKDFLSISPDSASSCDIFSGFLHNFHLQ